MQSNARASNEGYATGALGLTGSTPGMLELVENHDFAGAATSYTFSGLDGDTDEVYVLAFRVKKAVAAAMNLEIQPNAATTNQVSSGFFAGAGGTSGVLNNATMRVTEDGDATSGNVSEGVVIINAKTGMVRTARCNWVVATASPAVFSADFASVWNETATNITSLVFIANQANGIGAGSYARLYRLNKA